MKTQILLSSIALSLSFGLGLGCSPVTNNAFCDESTACDPLSDESFCSISDNNCIAPPSTNACNIVETCDDAALPFCMGETGEAVCVECEETADCTGSELCELTSHTCETFHCEVGADGDALCLNNFDELPYCGDAQECVECQESAHCTDSAAAVCDDFSCVSCTQDSECGDDYCEAGTCVAELRFVYVATDGSQDLSCGREDNPCEGVEFGLSQATAQRNELRIAPGIYSQTLDFTGGTRILRAMGKVVFDYSQEPGNQATPLISVENSANLSVFGIDFEHSNSSFKNTLIRCLNLTGSLSLDSISTLGGGTAISSRCGFSLTNSTISNPSGENGVEIVAGGNAVISGTTFVGNYAINENSSYIGVSCQTSSILIMDSSSLSGFATGLNVDTCDATIRSSTISENVQVGLSIRDSNFEITNNFITNNGVSNMNSGRGVDILNSSFPTATLQRFDFNTVAGNQGSSSSVNMRCTAHSSNPIEALGNILWDAVPISSNTDLSNCNFVYSSVEGVTNFDPEFVNPVAGPTGDYHLKSNSECIDKVDTDSLNIDIDGDERPMGIRHDMGADEAQ